MLLRRAFFLCWPLMQSQLGKCRLAATTRGPRLGLQPAALPGLELAGEQSVLLGPVEREIEFGEPGCGELDWLATLHDRLDHLRT